ncbi:hypothetical protein BIV57_11790 [Mangrovactinospora gilvigrisea]|uniref:Cell wall biosynthesis glycosyltransferase n=1 Tax=Mangrovactinospora gilvigrisea TaxID=1428644 RepID=A0A1J7CCB7_9ACTN|nr:glycosyltransferase [Mangrovactinospora gilvigrisea]OIV37322.1 hypothetical protein BIV57_11790 [Mangrovactinospora gilvigrisea]
MTVKVSVVVPVYNPGPHIEDCIASLLRQTLPDDEYETIFVDDGSNDGTPERLDRLAAEHPNVTVIHQEPSGWSGKPRNVGIEAARGKYIQFVDNDDYLGDEALERLWSYAEENSSDVVIGKMAGIGRSVPREVFRKNRPDATLANSQIIDSLTPHKMFRRAFLDDNGIRFKEGRRRLEDHVFVIEAYLRAKRISVLSDYVVYYHVTRDDVSNAAFQRIEPAGYMKNLEEALDLVDRYLEPGDVKDRTQRRWLRVEMVERMRGGRLLKQIAPEDRALWFDEISRVVKERFGSGVAAGLPPAQRAIAETFTHGTVEQLEALAEWEKSIASRTYLESAEWDGDALRIAFRAELYAGQEPLTFRAEGERDQLVLPALGPELGQVDATERLRKHTKAELVLRDRKSGAEVYVPVSGTRVERRPAGDGDGGLFRVVVHGEATIEPDRAGGVAGKRKPLAESPWDTTVRLHVAGWTKDAKLGKGRDTSKQALPAWITRSGVLTLNVGGRPAAGAPDPVLAGAPAGPARSAGAQAPFARKVRRRLGRIARALKLR